MENNKMKTKSKIIFMGTPEFGVVILKKLLEKNYEPALVVTSPDKPIGRKKFLSASPVKTFSLKRGLKIAQPYHLSEIKADIEKIDPDVIIVAAYGYILPKEIFQMPKYGTINVHPSLLPKYRGPSPIQSVIIAGERKTGATIIKIDEEIDHGPILAQKEMELSQNISYKDLHDSLANLGADLLVETLPKWLAGKIKPKEQNDIFASFTKIIEKEDGKIDWANETADKVERKVRAFQPWPSTFTYWTQEGKNKIIIKILKAEIKNLTSEGTPGKVSSDKEDKIIVQCKEGSLVIKRLQPEGKIEMTDKEFVLGHEGFNGTILK
jgi:methionyl-tRNA formyltransferase